MTTGVMHIWKGLTPPIEFLRWSIDQWYLYPHLTHDAAYATKYTSSETFSVLQIRSLSSNNSNKF